MHSGPTQIALRSIQLISNNISVQKLAVVDAVWFKHFTFIDYKNLSLTMDIVLIKHCVPNHEIEISISNEFE
jgi:hypothetical protein